MKWLLALLLATGACTSDHVVSGIAQNSDGDCQYIDVTALDGDTPLDHVQAECGFVLFNSEPVGTFHLHVPDGATDVTLDLQAHSQDHDESDDDAHMTAPLSGVVTDDVDLGTIYMN